MKNGTPAYNAAERLGVGITQLQNIRKRKIDILADYDYNASGSSKHRRCLTGNEEINE